MFIFEASWLSGGTTQPLPRDGETKGLRRDPTVLATHQGADIRPKIELHSQESNG